MFRSGVILILAVLMVLACASRPPEPRVVYRHRKHPRKTADTIPLGPPAIREDDPVVICARRFVRAMIDDNQSTAEGLISPKWVEEDGISLDTFMLSRLGIHVPPHTPFEVTDVRGDLVSVLATPESGYAQQLTVKVSCENSRYYIEPSGADHCCGSVDPWYWPAEP